jgi:hypothetical protein
MNALTLTLTLTLTLAPYFAVTITLRQTQGHLFWPIGL